MKKMRLYIVLWFCICLFSFELHAQNLVLNPSFENINAGNLLCNAVFPSPPALFNNSISNWTQPTDGTPNVYHASLPNACGYSTNSSSPVSFGKQTPRTGDS